MLGLSRSVSALSGLVQQSSKYTLRLASTSVASLRVGEATTSPEDKNNKASSLVNPLLVQDYFGVHKLFTVKDLFEARVHLGHKASALDPRMRQFLFGARFGTSIIDLDQTTLLLRQALNFTAHIAYRKRDRGRSMENKKKF